MFSTATPAAFNTGSVGLIDDALVRAGNTDGDFAHVRAEDWRSGWVSGAEGETTVSAASLGRRF
jgi:hypothetical protein